MRRRMARERGRLGRGLAAAVACLTLVLALAACESSSATSTSGPPTATSTAASTGIAGGQSTASLPVTPVNPGGAAVGPSGDVCQAAGTVTAQLPASIPAYPGGDLRIAQSGQGASLFGICTADAPAAVAQFYTGQLPSAGWAQIQTNAIAGTTLITAAKGDASLTLTIQPDPLAAGKTQIVIQATGV